MVDPKFNKLPPGAKSGSENDPQTSLTEEQRAEQARRSRAGLSINDTIAGNAKMSVGGRGTDTSGVKAGAGAGGGMTSVTAGDSGSPAPNIVPGAQSSGTTPRGTTGVNQEPSLRLDVDADALTRDEIAARAHRCWHERGCPLGSPEVDWQRAEEELRAERERRRTSAASA